MCISGEIQGFFGFLDLLYYIIDPAYKIILANLGPVTPPQKYTDVLYMSGETTGK